MSLGRFCSPSRSRCRGRGPLELDFCAQALQFPVDCGHHQYLATAAIGDRAVARVSVELGLVPVLGMTDIREAEIVPSGVDGTLQPSPRPTLLG